MSLSLLYTPQFVAIKKLKHCKTWWNETTSNWPQIHIQPNRLKRKFWVANFSLLFFSICGKMWIFFLLRELSIWSIVQISRTNHPHHFNSRHNHIPRIFFNDELKCSIFDGVCFILLVSVQHLHCTLTNFYNFVRLLQVIYCRMKLDVTKWNHIEYKLNCVWASNNLLRHVFLSDNTHTFCTKLNRLANVVPLNSMSSHHKCDFLMQYENFDILSSRFLSAKRIVGPVNMQVAI